MSDDGIGTMDGERTDPVEQAARVRESLARTLRQVRVSDPRPPLDGAAAVDDDPTLDPTAAKRDDGPGGIGALLARTREVIEHTRRVIEQTRASIARHPSAAPPSGPKDQPERG
jgi:hypothetical protein